MNDADFAYYLLSFILIFSIVGFILLSALIYFGHSFFNDGIIIISIISIFYATYYNIKYYKE